MEADGVGTGCHGLDHDSAQPPALLISLDLGREGRQNVGRASITQCTQPDGIEPSRQIFTRAIPSKRNRPAPSDDAMQSAVVQEHLEVCKIGNQRTQDRRRVLAVLVVLRPNISKESTCVLPEVRPLGRGEGIESRVWRKGLDVHLKILPLVAGRHEL